MSEPLTEGFFRELVARVTDGITVQQGGKLVYANDAAARLSGFESTEEFLSTPPSVVLERFEMLDESGAPFPPEKLPGRIAMATGAPAATNLRVRDRERGTTAWMSVKASPLFGPDGAVAFVVNLMHDVTAVRRRDEALGYLVRASELLGRSLEPRETVEQLAGLLVPEFADWCAVHVVGGDGIEPVTVAHVDPSKARLARDLQRRYPVDPNARQGLAQVIRSGEPELHPNITEEMVARAARDADHLRALLELGFKSAMIVPLPARGRTIGGMTLITGDAGRRYDQRDLELSLELGRRAGAALENARLYEDARESSRAHEQFLKLLAKEVSAPVHALGAGLKELSRAVGAPADLNEEGLRQSAAALTERCHVLELVARDLGQLAAIAGGGLELRRERLDVRRLLDEVLAALEPIASKRCSPFVLAVGTSCFCTLDRERIAEALRALIMHALENGAGKPVEVMAERIADVLTVRVQDRGPAFNQADQRRLFGRFEHAVSASAERGLGVDLWVANEIIKAHGGTLTIESEASKGTVFRIEIPCAD